MVEFSADFTSATFSATWRWPRPRKILPVSSKYPPRQQDTVDDKILLTTQTWRVQYLMLRYLIRPESLHHPVEEVSLPLVRLFHQQRGHGSLARPVHLDPVHRLPYL